MLGKKKKRSLSRSVQERRGKKKKERGFDFQGLSYAQKKKKKEDTARQGGGKKKRANYFDHVLPVRPKKKKKKAGDQ